MNVSHFTHMNASARIFKCVMKQSWNTYERVMSYIGVQASATLAGTYECVMSHGSVFSHIRMSHGTHMHESCHSRHVRHEQKLVN